MAATQEQIIHGFEATKEVQEKVMKEFKSSETKQPIQETIDIVQDLERLLVEKNRDDALQNFLHHAYEFGKEIQYSKGLQMEVREAAEKLWTEENKEVAWSMYDSLKSCLMIFLRSGDVRNNVNEFISLARMYFEDVLSTGTVTAKEGPTMEPTSFGEKKLEVEAKDKNIEFKFTEQPETRMKKEEVVDNFKSLLRRLSYNPEWKNVVHNFFYLTNFIYFSVGDVPENLKKRAEYEIWNNEHFQGMLLYGRVLLERFCGKAFVDDVKDKWNEFVNEIKNNEEMRIVLSDLKNWLYKVLDDPDLLEYDSTWDELNSTIKRSESWAGFMKDRTWPLVNSFSEMIKQAGNDPTTVRLIRDLDKLSKEFFTTGPHGELKLRMGKINRFRDELFQILRERLQSIELPIYEDIYDAGMFGGKYYIKIEGAVLNVYEVLPDRTLVRLENNLDFNFKTFQTYSSVSSCQFLLKGIYAHFKDLKFHYRKYDSEASDSGLFDLEIEGCQIHIQSNLNAFDKFAPFLDVKKVECKIDSCKVTVKDSHHDTWNNMITTLFQGKLKRNMEENIEKRIIDMIALINGKVNNLAEFVPNEEIYKFVQQQLTPFVAPKPGQTLPQ